MAAQLTEIIRRDPPVPPSQRRSEPTTVVDAQILAALAGGERLELRDIVAAVGRSTHHVHARVGTLVRKGLVSRYRPPGAPSRGPGASLYQLIST